ncbi:metallo-beta-lactamase superfamily protein [Colletotrichum graminicola]|uniref:Metallo-beta-lactamase superfamily protein n=1 Tax=Colletotrichum graminicola (strain M1.001 / M2 / FGSC 10212) TaxID=645133 RepID=E3QPT2_COLGM|nr:metallo-beta-lactamase superfamily protein [Colletotrichum graminicola M1.001]EFQ32859.1 metallo-beta-lactamase superfamily protein [Colletotrichum graminicola M1.001]WDK16508.1 metallo-beta-lactamase superfamily protein [Colletotrichum graminicola]
MDLLICGTCGVQYGSHSIKSCKICDDPRQYVPEGGQWFTTLRELQDSRKHRNVFTKDKYNSSVVAIRTEPPVGIGQRAFLLRSAIAGNLLWDCITYIDDETVSRIVALGGIDAIVISHPHYFSTALHWAEAFGCKVYVSAEDAGWLPRRGDAHVLWEGLAMEFLYGQFLAVKVAGHFPGSSVLLWKSEKKLFVADSVMVVPSGMYHVDRPEGTASFTFMWSYPNMIPLSPDAVYGIWKAVSVLDFDDAHSAFIGRDARGDAKRRLLESAQIFIKSMGYIDHPIRYEEV